MMISTVLRDESARGEVHSLRKLKLFSVMVTIGLTPFLFAWSDMRFNDLSVSIGLGHLSDVTAASLPLYKSTHPSSRIQSKPLSVPNPP